MFSCAHINRGSRDRKLGEETRDVGENTVLGEERQGAEEGEESCATPGSIMI